MDNEEEKEMIFRPYSWLYVFLFIYYTIWLWQAYGAVSHYIAFGFGSFRSYAIVEWLCFMLFFCAGVYSLYAVIKTLRGDKDCITSLKWPLILVCLYTLADPTRRQIPTDNTLVWCGVFLARPLFYLTFYLFLCFAGSMRRHYPKAERRFGPSGWIWIGLTVAFLAVGAYGWLQQYRIARYCKPVDIGSLNLAPGDISDGYVAFRSGRKWENWKDPEDRLYIDGRIDIHHTIMSMDSISRIYVASGRCDKADARTCNQVIVWTLDWLSKNTDVDSGNLREGCFLDTIVAGKRLMSTMFEATPDSVPAYIDVVMITESAGPKCSVIARYDRNPIGSEWAIDMANDLRFDLQDISKSKDNEHRDNAKKKQPDAASQHSHKSDANMPASLFQSLSPCLLFGVMTLEHYEREIAYRKRDYIFHYL